MMHSRLIVVLFYIGVSCAGMAAAGPATQSTPEFRYIESWCPVAGEVHLCWTTSQIAETGCVEYGIDTLDRKTPWKAWQGRNHRVTLQGLVSGKDYRGRIVAKFDGKTIESETFRFSAAPPVPGPTKSLDVPLAVPEPTGAPRHDWPTTVGIPFARGALGDVQHLRLFDGKGSPVMLQAECFSRWPDGSVKWATISFPATTEAPGTIATYRLKAQSQWPEPCPATEAVLRVRETEQAWEVASDALALDIPKRTPALFHRVGFDRNGDGVVGKDERIEAAPLGANLRLETGDGVSLTCGSPDPASFAVEVNGPVRAILAWTGPLVTAEGRTAGWRYLVRMTLCRRLAGMAVNLSIWNDQEKPEFRAVGSLALRIPLDGAGGVRGAFDDRPLENVPDGDGLWIHQDKDNHFAVRTASGVVEGQRAGGVGRAADDHMGLTVLLPRFWQTYPKGMAVKPDGVHVRLMPSLKPDTYADADNQRWFYRLYAWFKDGEYLLRAGQLTQHELFVQYGKPESGARPLADWLAHPLLPQAEPAYLCSTGVLGRPVFARTEGVWDDYERYLAKGFAASLKDRDACRTYGWMHYGDWYGERICNYGNNEYDMAWTLGVQWMRTSERSYFDRGLEMARHHSTVDTMHGTFADALPGLVWEHCFNHVGTGLSVEELRVPPDDRDGTAYLREQSRWLGGRADPQGHVFEQGNWLYAALTGDPWLRQGAERVCTHQAERLTRAFNFGIERCGGWPLINAATAYGFTGDPYYLNAARLMVERCLERQDPQTGSWPHKVPRNETNGKNVIGGKAFAVGVLTHGLLCYLDQEPKDRPDVRRMLVRGADWLMNDAWDSGKGFRYITAPGFQSEGRPSSSSPLNADVVGFAYEQTNDPKYLAFWKEMMAGAFAGELRGNGKSFSQDGRQTVFGLDRVRKHGVVSAPRR